MADYSFLHAEVPPQSLMNVNSDKLSVERKASWTFILYSPPHPTNIHRCNLVSDWGIAPYFFTPRGKTFVFCLPYFLTLI